MDFFLKKQSNVIALHADGQKDPVAVRSIGEFSKPELLTALVTLISGSEKLNGNPADIRKRRTRKLDGFRLYNTQGRLCYSYDERTGLKNYGRELV